MLPTILNDLWMTSECLLATDLYVLLRQERPLLRESAGILQNAWWENWKGKKKQKKQRSTSSPEHFVTLHDGAEWQKWRIIPSLGPNLSERGHNRWQNSDSKQKQSVGWAKAWVFWAVPPKTCGADCCKVARSEKQLLCCAPRKLPVISCVEDVPCVSANGQTWDLSATPRRSCTSMFSRVWCDRHVRHCWFSS